MPPQPRLLSVYLPCAKPVLHTTLPTVPFRLEQFYYLNYKAFPPIINATGNQCFSFMNQAKGGFCSLNSCIFPTYSGWTKHGSSESEGCTRGGMHRSGV